MILIHSFWLYLVLLTSVSYAVTETDDPVKEERDALAARRDALTKIDTIPVEQAIPYLGEGLRKMGDPSIYHFRDETGPVFSATQSKLISIPGHATFYRDKINALREQLMEGKLSLEDWAEQKLPYFQVMEHIPSEEAVEVLCTFAGDDFATYGPNDPKNANIPGFKDWKFSDYDIDFTVSFAAMNALDALQIENGPSLKGLQVFERAQAWSQWWREVKAGKRKYRFKGSSVEHPINPPPGTFREPRRPEKHPSPQSDATEKAPASDPTQASAHAAPPSTRWPVIAGVVALLLAALIFLRKIMRRG